MFEWINKNWRKMSDMYRSYGNHRNCYMCHKAFENGDMMALGQFINMSEATQVALCQSCADKQIVII